MKNPNKKYWVGICPPAETEEAVAALKQELKEQIGWYASVNSKAHITFCEFYDSMGKLTAMQKYLTEFCSSLESFSITLNRASHLHKAYCLYPDENSKNQLIRLMRHFHSNRPFATETKSIHPHLSIGRQLNEEQQKAAELLFAGRAFDIKFVCNHLTIRKFNPDKKQYDVYKQHKFGKQIV